MFWLGLAIGFIVGIILTFVAIIFFGAFSGGE